MKVVYFGKTNELLPTDGDQMWIGSDRGPTVVRPWSDFGLTEKKIEFGDE